MLRVLAAAQPGTSLQLPILYIARATGADDYCRCDRWTRRNHRGYCHWISQGLFCIVNSLHLPGIAPRQYLHTGSHVDEGACSRQRSGSSDHGPKLKNAWRSSSFSHVSKPSTPKPEERGGDVLRLPASLPRYTYPCAWTQSSPAHSPRYVFKNTEKWILHVCGENPFGSKIEAFRPGDMPAGTYVGSCPSL